VPVPIFETCIVLTESAVPKSRLVGLRLNTGVAGMVIFTDIVWFPPFEVNTTLPLRVFGDSPLLLTRMTVVTEVLVMLPEDGTTEIHPSVVVAFQLTVPVPVLLMVTFSSFCEVPKSRDIGDNVNCGAFGFCFTICTVTRTLPTFDAIVTTSLYVPYDSDVLSAVRVIFFTFVVIDPADSLKVNHPAFLVRV
jgi:hypothetical protein